MGKGAAEKPIDWEEFEKLCEIHCTLVEIASFFRVDQDTMHNRVKKKYGQPFTEVFKIKSGPGRISLRRAQFRAAEKGNVAMLIWLGKQYLGQREKSELETHVHANVKFTDADYKRALAEVIRNDDC